MLKKHDINQHGVSDHGRRNEGTRAHAIESIYFGLMTDLTGAEYFVTEKEIGSSDLGVREGAPSKMLELLIAAGVTESFMKSASQVSTTDLFSGESSKSSVNRQQCDGEDDYMRGVTHRSGSSTGRRSAR